MKYRYYWGTSPANFLTAGDASPRPPPAFDAHVHPLRLSYRRTRSSCRISCGDGPVSSLTSASSIAFHAIDFPRRRPRQLNVSVLSCDDSGYGPCLLRGFSLARRGGARNVEDIWRGGGGQRGGDLTGSRLESAAVAGRSALMGADALTTRRPSCQPPSLNTEYTCRPDTEPVRGATPLNRHFLPPAAGAKPRLWPNTCPWTAVQKWSFCCVNLAPDTL